MINSVQNIKVGTTSPFNDFKSNGEYYITREIAKDIYQDSEKKSERKGKRVGLIVALSSIATTLGVIGITKGIPKTVYKHVSDYVKKLGEKVNLRKQNGQSGPITSFMNYAHKKLTKFAERGQSVNNFNNYKDLIVKHAMYKTHFTTRIHQKITAFFERLALKTVNKGYKNSDKRFTKLFNSIASINSKIMLEDPSRKITINGVTKSAIEWIDDVIARRERIQQELQNGFSVASRQTRHSQMRSANVGLDKKVWELTLNGIQHTHGMKGKFAKLKDSQMHQSFIAEELLAKDKSQIAEQIAKSRRSITHDITDAYTASEKLLDGIYKHISPEDAESRKLLKIMHSKLNTYKKLSGPQESVYREKIKSEIFEIMETITKRSQNDSSLLGYTSDSATQISAYSKELQKTLNGVEKGELQELLTIYKGLLPREEYLKLRGEANKAVKTLDKAIHTESNLFFDKLRDLSLGSAPTDILSILGSVGGVGLGLSMADNKDERISAALKYGIPIVGSLATSVVLTVGLVSGIKAMLIGMASGAVINRIGTAIDKKRKEYNKDQEDKKHTEEIKNEIQKAETDTKTQTESV